MRKNTESIIGMTSDEEKTTVRHRGDHVVRPWEDPGVRHGEDHVVKHWTDHGVRHGEDHRVRHNEDNVVRPCRQAQSTQ